MTGTREYQLEKWVKTNPVILVNIQDRQQRCGRFPTIEQAVIEAKSRGDGWYAIEGQSVLFCEMPSM